MAHHEECSRPRWQRRMRHAGSHWKIDAIQTVAGQVDHKEWLTLVESNDRLYLRELEPFNVSPGLEGAYAGERSDQHPQLVTVVGMARSGKSTVAQLLMQSDSQSRGKGPGDVLNVPASFRTSTPEQIGLHKESPTWRGRSPLFVADCDDFEELQPVEMDWSSPQDPGHLQEIRWVTSGTMRARPSIIRSFFPRLLLPLSRCMIFVLRDIHASRSMLLSRLLHWGSWARGGCTNSPGLPHCIVVLNGGMNHTKNLEEDTETLTRTVLRSFDAQESSTSHYRHYESHLRNSGYLIESVQDILLHYYATFAVIDLPHMTWSDRLERRIRTLRGLVDDACELGTDTHHQAATIAEIGIFDAYKASAFNHLTMHLDRPFDFGQASRSRQAVPNTFRHHVLSLFVALSTSMRLSSVVEERKVMRMFENLNPVLASCTLLDQERCRRRGVVRELVEYMPSLRFALDTFAHKHHLCSRKDGRSGRSCKLTRLEHVSRGHEDGAGAFATGDFETGLDAAWLEDWTSQTLNGNAVRMLHQEIQRRRILGTSDQRIALELHLERLNSFSEHVWPISDVHSHVVCLICLMGTAEHVLPCGHMLCSTCVRDCGQAIGSSVHMGHCPMHGASTHWLEPTIVQLSCWEKRPRVLVLPEERAQCIAALQVLCMLEDRFEKLGGKLSVRACFELVVGAGDGGLLAIMVSKKTPSLRECCRFLQAVYAAKSKAPWSRFAHSRRNARRTDMLKSAFQGHTLSPASAAASDFVTRVALACSDSGREEVVVLANYRRPENPTLKYRFERFVDPAEEPDLWRVATMMLSSRASQQSHGLNYRREIIDLDLAVLGRSECEAAFPENDGPSVVLALGHAQKGTNHGAEHESNLRERCKTIFADHGKWVDDEGAQRIQIDPLPDADLLLSQQGRARSSAERDAARRTLDELVTQVAYALLASSFYLLPERLRVDDLDMRHLEGHIVCIFGEGSEEMEAMASILTHHESEHFKPYFVIASGNAKVKVSARFNLRTRNVQPTPFSVPVTSDSDAIVCHLVQLPDDRIMPHGRPISTGCTKSWGDHVSSDLKAWHANVPGLTQEARSASPNMEPVELPASSCENELPRKKQGLSLQSRDSVGDDLIRFVERLISGVSCKTAQ